MENSIITGTGSYIPDLEVKNSDFLNASFYDEKGEKLTASNDVIVSKFKDITGIGSRRYISNGLVTSDIAAIAAQRAIEDAGVDAETLDYIIVAHNYGDIKSDQKRSDIMPSLGTRVKHSLKIKNPQCVAFDILFGCPGWLQGVIQAYAFIRAGMAEKCLIIGAETLSRVVDPHDRDSMIYSDGAGACVIEKVKEGETRGILSIANATHAYEEAGYLYNGSSYKPGMDTEIMYIKMYGRKIYEYALNNVPAAMKLSLEKSGQDITEVKKILIHQANEKMDAAIIKRFYRLYKNPNAPEGIMPMSINKLGNSSVATVPTLLDLILKGKLEGHSINKGDTLILASVGAGMNINAVVYKY